MQDATCAGVVSFRHKHSLHFHMWWGVVSPTTYFTAWGGIHFQYSLDTVLVILLHVSYTGYCCMCRTLVIAACVVHWLLLHVSYTGYCCMCRTLVIAACVVHWLLLHVSYTGYCCMCHCIAGVMCGQLDAPSNGVILPPNIDGAAYFGYTVTYSCERGYDLIGPVMRTCQADGQWNGSVPTCESEILGCHEDLCVFTSLSLA